MDYFNSVICITEDGLYLQQVPTYPYGSEPFDLQALPSRAESTENIPRRLPNLLLVQKSDSSRNRLLYPNTIFLDITEPANGASVFPFISVSFIQASTPNTITCVGFILRWCDGSLGVLPS